MKYYSYNDYETDPSIDPIVRTLSEKEIILEYWDYWYDRMCKKFSKELVDKNYTHQDCIDDWCVVHWAWEQYDAVVEAVLQKHHDKLRKITEDINSWRVTSYISQMAEIENAIALWKDRHKFADFSNKITEYLCAGGFFNPEMMNHDKVRDLLIEIRNLFSKHE